MSHVARMGAVLALVALSLTACGSEPDGQGGMDNWSPVPAADNAEPAPTPTDSPDPRLADAIAGLGDKDPDDGVDGELPQTVDAVGTVNLVWESTGAERRLFSYDLTECTVDGTNISVEGVGVEDATGAPSTLSMAVTAAELLHAGTGTYHGSGRVMFTADGSEVVSDGRIHSTPQGYTGPSMFDYRVTDTTVEFKAAWWIGATDVGAGALDVVCDA